VGGKNAVLRGVELRGGGERELFMRKNIAVFAALAVAAVPAYAVSIVDYATLGTAVSTELTAGIAAALAVVGIIWGARIGLNFVRSMMR
jgi:hypothetical protein